MTFLRWLLDLVLYALNAPARAQGAAEERDRSRAEAERQEDIARRAGEGAADGEDDPRDLRRD